MADLSQFSFERQESACDEVINLRSFLDIKNRGQGDALSVLVSLIRLVRFHIHEESSKNAAWEEIVREFKNCWPRGEAYLGDLSVAVSSFHKLRTSSDCTALVQHTRQLLRVIVSRRLFSKFKELLEILKSENGTRLIMYWKNDRAVWTLTLLENIQAILRNLEDEDRSTLANYLLGYSITWIKRPDIPMNEDSVEDHWKEIRKIITEICGSDGIWGSQALVKSDINAEGCYTVEDFLRKHRLIRQDIHPTKPVYKSSAYRDRMPLDGAAYELFFSSYLQKLRTVQNSIS